MREQREEKNGFQKWFPSAVRTSDGDYCSLGRLEMRAEEKKISGLTVTVSGEMKIFDYYSDRTKDLAVVVKRNAAGLKSGMDWSRN